MPTGCFACLEVGASLAAAGLAVWRSQESGASRQLPSGAEAPGEAKPSLPAPLSLESQCEGLAAQLPAGRPRVCILGGTSFKDPDSELVVKSLARHFARHLSSSVVVLTGGMPGVQETFARSMGVEGRRWSSGIAAGSSEDLSSSVSSGTLTSIVNLLPAGEASNYGVGCDLEAGSCLEDRKKIFAQLGHIYLTVEGGPGVAQEASQAFARGAVILPISCTGGASSGMFDFPKGALEQPEFASEEQWQCLQKKGDPDETALAVVQLVWTLISKGGVVGRQVGVGAAGE